MRAAVTQNKSFRTFRIFWGLAASAVGSSARVPGRRFRTASTASRLICPGSGAALNVVQRRELQRRAYFYGLDITCHFRRQSRQGGQPSAVCRTNPPDTQSGELTGRTPHPLHGRTLQVHSAQDARQSQAGVQGADVVQRVNDAGMGAAQHDDGPVRRAHNQGLIIA